MADSPRPDAIEVKVEVKPSSEATLAPAAYANVIQVATDAMGMTTLYFFTLPPDMSSVPGAAEQMEAWRRGERRDDPVLNVALPASAKVVVPATVLDSLVEIVSRRRGGNAH